ncbi:hypothetical protein QYF61_008327 [Mycteria americana]|uniref:Reverse transcriptase domain-containing protein n=1 Tax=Mycteria americana TaxID=33587 RepID=A0AAN7PIA2_MYCAM|nr:hypothetical protein QYF61_008327 [Mycteria americana]
MDLLLAKAEPTSDMITYLRKVKKSCTAAVRERHMRKCERNNPADTKVREQGWGRGAPCAGSDIPLKPVVKTMVVQVVALQPTEDHSGADIHPAACGGPYAGAGIPGPTDQGERLEQGRLTFGGRGTGLIEGVTEYLSKLDIHKSMDPDRVSEDCRNVNVTPIFKKGKKEDQGQPPLIPGTVMEHLILETISRHMNNKKVIRMDIVCLDFSKAFNTVSHKILTEKLIQYGLDEQTRVVISGTKSSWRPATSNVPPRSILGSVFFDIFINEMDDRAECTFSKFANDTKLGGVADMPEGHAAIQAGEMV